MNNTLKKIMEDTYKVEGSIVTSRSQKNNLILSTKQSSSSLTDVWDTIIKFFKSDESKNKEPKDTIRKQLCNCPKTKNRYYCDNIDDILQMIKNNNSKRSKELYQNLLTLDEQFLDKNGENLHQIQKDITRTFPSTITLNQKDNILKKLENVLRAFSNYDNRIKYCQGMNFIVGFLLYHSEEHIAFWLFVSLIEEYDLRNVYMDKFPGLNYHVKKLEEILKNEYNNYWENFEEVGVKVEIFMVEWLLSLFSSLIPLELQIDFYKGFFSQGWLFFYKMCISVILNLKGNYLDADEIYIGLKNGKNDENLKEEDIKNSWKNIIKKAYNIEIKTNVLNINKK